MFAFVLAAALFAFALTRPAFEPLFALPDDSNPYFCQPFFRRPVYAL